MTLAESTDVELASLTHPVPVVGSGPSTAAVAEGEDEVADSETPLAIAILRKVVVSSLAASIARAARAAPATRDSRPVLLRDSRLGIVEKRINLALHTSAWHGARDDSGASQHQER